MPLASSNGYKTSCAVQDCGTGDLTKDCFMFFISPPSVYCLLCYCQFFLGIILKTLNILVACFNPFFKSFCFVLFPSQIPDVGEEEAVRIFIEFERMESAIKGKVHQCEMVTYCG